jgi:hypothetical protein
MNQFDRESIVLALVLRHGTAAAQVVLPYLTPDKFVFDMDGGFGISHSLIWENITEAFFEKQSPVYANIVTRLPEYDGYLDSLVRRLNDQYHLYELEESLLRTFAEKIETSGV